MEAIIHLHALAALPLKNLSLAPTELKALIAPDPICIRWWGETSLLLSQIKYWSSSLSPSSHYIQWAILAPQMIVVVVGSFWENVLPKETVYVKFLRHNLCCWWCCCRHCCCMKSISYPVCRNIYNLHTAHSSVSITVKWEAKWEFYKHILQSYISINNFMTLYIVSSLNAHVAITNCRKWTGTRLGWPLVVIC
jgi:hypothetical protein